MKIAVIHNFDSHDRFDRLMQEFIGQGIGYYQIFPAIHDQYSVRKGINLAHKQCVRLAYRDWETDRKSTRLNSSHSRASRMPSSA